jgi:triosephosphate isomerase
MARKPMMAANWKMHKTLRETEDYVASLLPRVEEATERADVAVFPPFTALAKAARMAETSRVMVGAQNLFYEDEGAFTGEVSAPMLLDLGVEAVIVGHSERREVLGESDEMVARKVVKALSSGMLPVICVGETKEERDAGGMWEKISGQVRSVINALEGNVSGEELVFAYEPIWAIGTGDTATPDDAQDASRKIRTLLEEMHGEQFSENVRILYGGSIKPENVGEIMSQDDVDGGLVGGASLDVQTFIQLVGAMHHESVE